MNIEFDATLLAAVALAQSTDVSRYYLCGVYFDGQSAVATDGRVMTAARDIESVNMTPGVILPVSKKALAALKKKTANRMRWSDSNGVLEVLDANDSVLHMEPAAIVNGTFPDWLRVVPRKMPGADMPDNTSAAFAPKVMQHAVDVAKVLNASGYRVTGTADGGNLVRYATGGDVFSVLYPIRFTDAPTEAPAWIFNTPADTEQAA